MTVYLRYAFSFLLVVCVVPHTFSQVITLENGREITSLGSALYYFIDTENEDYTIEEITRIDSDAKWQKNPSDHLSLGYTFVPVWMKVTVRNESDVNDWHLALNNSFLPKIDFYQCIKDSLVYHTKMGASLPYHARGEIKSNGFVFPLKIQKNQVSTYYIRVHSRQPCLFPILILTKARVFEKIINRHIGYGIYFGILLVMILYNLVVFAMTKDFNYLYYVLTVIFTLLVFSVISGYLFKYVYPSLPVLNSHVSFSSRTGIIVTTSIFAIHFLELKKRHIWFYRYFLFMVIFVLCTMLYNYTKGHDVLNSITKLQAVSLLGVGIYGWYKGNKYARFFVLAWSFYILGGLLISFRNSGVLPINFLTNYGAYIGSALETIIVSMALADRYRSIRKEKEEAVKKAFALEKKTQAELEKQVKKRTQKLNEANEELSITVEMVKHQKTEIEKKNDSISSSLNYAQRIQNSILPSLSQMKDCFADIFVLYLPRDVVSGDFYFYHTQENRMFLATADCTGHGIPGALMSMIGINILYKIIMENKAELPAEILMRLHEEVVYVLKQRTTGNSDGMDMALCMIDTLAQKIYFSGAKNPLLCIHKNNITIHKGSRYSVGGLQKTKGIYFENQIMDINHEAFYYMFSDGYQDQFGGENNRKFMRKKLRELLRQTHTLSGQKQQEILQQKLSHWMTIADTTQTDDVLLLGFKFKRS